MASPITWQNVAAPSFSEGAVIMGQAQDSFNKGLGALNGIVEGGMKRRDDKISDDSALFMEQLRSNFQTPEALREAQSSGKLDELRRQFGKLDVSKTDSAAVDGLITNLQTRTNADLAYKDSQLFESTKDAQGDFSMALSTGDFETARSMIDKDMLYDANASLGQLDARMRQDAQDKRTAYDRSESIRLAKKGEALTDLGIQREEEDRTKRIAEQDRLDGIRAEGIEAYMDLEAESALFDNQVKKINDHAQKEYGGLEQFLGEDGKVDQKKVDAAGDIVRMQVALSQNELKSLTPVMSMTDRKKAMNMNLVGNHGATTAEANAISAELDASFAASNAASVADTARIDAQRKEIDSQYANNSIVQEKLSGKKPFEIAQEVYDEMSPEMIDALGRPDMSKVVDVLSQISSSGFNYRGKTVPVSKNMLKWAIAETDNGDWFGSDNKLADTLENLIDSDDWKYVIAEAQQYSGRVAQLDSARNTDKYDSASVLNLFNSVDVISSQERVDETRRLAREKAAEVLANDKRTAESNKRNAERRQRGLSDSSRY